MRTEPNRIGSDQINDSLSALRLGCSTPNSQQQTMLPCDQKSDDDSRVRRGQLQPSSDEEEGHAMILQDQEPSGINDRHRFELQQIQQSREENSPLVHASQGHAAPSGSIEYEDDDTCETQEEDDIAEQRYLLGAIQRALDAAEGENDHATISVHDDLLEGTNSNLDSNSCYDNVAFDTGSRL